MSAISARNIKINIAATENRTIRVCSITFMGGTLLVELSDPVGTLSLSAVVAPTLVAVTGSPALSAIGVPWEVL